MANVSSADLKRAALGLAANGFTVFPIKPGDKSPPLVKFTKQATADPIEVARMWKRYPEANIGVHAGGGTVIVDADTYKNPSCLDGLAIPETTTVRSASGGRHFYLLGSGSTRTDVRPGLDIKGRGGYAVGPGSVFDGRSYRWAIPPWEVPPQPAPTAVLKLIRERPKFQALDTRPIPKGRRNNTLTQIAGWFVSQGVRGEPLRIALHAINRDRCKPSMEEAQVDKIAKSASSWPDPPLWLVDPVRFGPSRHGRVSSVARLRETSAGGHHYHGGQLERPVRQDRQSSRCAPPHGSLRRRSRRERGRVMGTRFSSSSDCS
jgi:Bifunctional DNA primase/polymerase, N-terminal/Primase C terminal 1 (PriCT-1)